MAEIHITLPIYIVISKMTFKVYLKSILFLPVVDHVYMWNFLSQGMYLQIWMPRTTQIVSWFILEL